MITLEPVQSFAVQEYLLTRMAFSPDGATLAVGHRNFRTYNAATGAPGVEFPFADFLAQLRYSPDGRRIAAVNIGDNHPATRGRISVFNAADASLEFTAAAAQPVETCAFAAPPEEALYWNSPSAQTSGTEIAALSPQGAPAPLAVPELHVRGLAARPGGLVCFGREAVGSVQRVEGADLIFRKFHLLSLDADGARRQDIDLGIGAGVHALSSDGKLLAVEMVDFKNNERHVSLIDVETGVEANLLPLESNTLPVLEFGLGSEFLLCMKEDAEANFNLLRVWRTSDLKLLGEARVALSYHSLATCLEHSLVAFLGDGQVAIFALA